MLLIDVFVIPSSSMRPTLVEGDYVLMNKWKYGARMPFTPLSWPFSNTWPGSQKKAYSESLMLDYHRLPGWSTIQQNDILVFNYPFGAEPIDRKQHFVKRCIGVPNDTLQIINGSLLVNGDISDYSNRLQFDYNLITLDKKLDKTWMKEWAISEGGQRTTKGHYRFALSAKKADSLAQQPYIKRIERAIQPKGIIVAKHKQVFPSSTEYFPWNIDNFGPLIVPKKGRKIKLNPHNYLLYKSIIKEFEQKEIRDSEEGYYIDNELVKNYTFDLNYYFVMGDNRHHSVDSRYWGFLPENHIVGKADIICFSVQPHLKWFHKGGIRWNRLFDKIK